MIVTTRARHGQCHCAAHQDVDAIIDDVWLVVEKAPAQRQEAERRQRTFVFAEIKLVGGNLLNEKLVVGQVFIESTDDIIAIGVRIGKAPFLIAGQITFGVGITRDIEPVPSPTFAVLRRRQQAINHAGECFRCLVGDECFHLLRRGRQTGQIERGPPNQAAFVRLS